MKERNIALSGKTVLITGGAGFIGANLAQRLLCGTEPVRIVVIDNLNDYYDPNLKLWRLEQIRAAVRDRAADGSSFEMIRGSIADARTVREVFRQFAPSVVVNLAAQAGVRYSTIRISILNPTSVGFYNILEACRHSYDGGAEGVEHLVYASSSSVYGGNKKLPYSTEDQTDTPVSLYAATKKADELLAHAYARLYNIPATGLRFFTVYGPAGRRIWHILNLQICSGKGKPSGFSIMETVRGILLMWMISRKGSCGSWAARRNAARVRTACPSLRIQYTISGTAIRSICWSLWISCIRS